MSASGLTSVTKRAGRLAYPELRVATAASLDPQL